MLLFFKIVLMLNCRGMILSQDKYRDTQSENFYILCLFDFMLLSIENVDLIFMQCSHCEASCKKTCGSKHSAKPYMVLGLVYIFQSNSYLCINRKSTHSSNWYYIKGYVFEKILFKMTLKYQMLVLSDNSKLSGIDIHLFRYWI